MPFDPTQLAPRFDAPSVQALVLVGSAARGDVGPFSDIDRIRRRRYRMGAAQAYGVRRYGGRRAPPSLPICSRRLYSRPTHC